jgi:hypothetical protein
MATDTVAATAMDAPDMPTVDAVKAFAMAIVAAKDTEVAAGIGGAKDTVVGADIAAVVKASVAVENVAAADFTAAVENVAAVAMVEADVAKLPALYSQ